MRQRRKHRGARWQGKESRPRPCLMTCLVRIEEHGGAQHMHMVGLAVRARVLPPELDVGMLCAGLVRAAGDRWGPLGTAGDRWGPLGIAGDRWGPLGTPGMRGLQRRRKVIVSRAVFKL